MVFPAIDLILVVFFFAKLGLAYFDYRKHGQFEWAAPAILFACLVFTLTAPLYICRYLHKDSVNRKNQGITARLSSTIKAKKQLGLISYIWIEKFTFS